VAAHQEDGAKLPLKAQTGWSFWTDHPVRAFKDAFGDIFWWHGLPSYPRRGLPQLSNSN